ncbi:hypothetical protein BDV41DRAFT_263881 [Aspergillus transmontanensis]|uniref:Uncharacterized protein n=1 Tax=Aspergillus transmontanensis TaxID=1034304 RepID=A0A5N6VXT0_9EURO|nr:hypothetical protein BDV41DRAFT_263881 [Aspergillus transmontanensis]
MIDVTTSWRVPWIGGGPKLLSAISGPSAKELLRLSSLPRTDCCSFISWLLLQKVPFKGKAGLFLVLMCSYFRT